MAQRAYIEHREASLASEFGESLARRVFGDAMVDSAPRISRGFRKGKIAGHITWYKCSRGGWGRIGDGTPGVVRPGTYNIELVTKAGKFRDPRAFMTESMFAAWNAAGRPAWGPDDLICEMEARWSKRDE